MELFENVDQIVISLHFEYMNKFESKFLKCIFSLEEYRIRWNKEYELGKIHQGFRRKKTLLVRFIVLPGQLSNIRKLAAKLDRKVEKIEFRDIRSPRFSQISERRKKILKKRQEQNTPALEYINKILKADQIKEGVKKKMGTLGYDIYSKEERGFFEEMFGKPRKKMIGFYKEDKNIYSKNIFYQDLIFNKENKFKNWYCMAGLSSIKIAPNGDIYRGSCHQGGVIGNVYLIDKKFELPKELIVCNKSYCNDIIDLRQNKVAKKRYLRLLT